MKETLYLLPGLLCDQSLWFHQIELLSKSYDVRVADFSKGDTIDDFCDEVLKDAPESFSLAGLSMGGYVAFEVLRRSPDRVKRLALIDTSPYADLPEHRLYRQGLMDLAQDKGLDPVMDILIAKLIHPSRHDDENLVRLIDAMANRVGVEGFLRQQTALLNRKDSLSDLSNIKCPTVVIVGKEDILTPASVAKVMADAIPNAHLVEVDNCAHLSTMEQPEIINRILLDWLTE
jgi:pimeloyl-ACP methyl ester carboxylesterase